MTDADKLQLCKKNYSDTCLIRHALGEEFYVGIDRVSDFTVLNIYTCKWSNKIEN